MTRSSIAIADSLAGLAWSLWAELGVSGWERHHQAWCIDLEALIVLTSALGDTDPRLRDESTDWCISYARLVSAVRLKYLIADVDRQTRRSFDEFSATVGAYARINWTGPRSARPYTPTGRSHVETLNRASQLAIRLRAVFGTGARAEIIRAFASAPNQSFTVAELAEHAGYGRRAIHLEVDMLQLSGNFEKVLGPGPSRIRLTRPRALLDFVGPLPKWLPVWPAVVRTMIAGLRFCQQFEDSPEIVRSIEGAKLLRSMKRDLDLAGLITPLILDPATTVWDPLVSWLMDTIKDLAQGDPRTFRPGTFSSQAN